MSDLFRRYETPEAAHAAIEFIDAVAAAEMPEARGMWYVHPLYPDGCGCEYGSYNSDEGHCYGCGCSFSPVEWAICFTRHTTMPVNTPEDEAHNGRAEALCALAKRRWAERSADVPAS